MKLCITGGGTGGHLAIAKSLAKAANKQQVQTIFIGSTSGQDRNYFEHSSLFEKKLFLQTTGIVNKKGIQKLTALFQIFKAFLYARKTLKQTNTDLVFSVGGFSAAPASFAALSLGIPLAIHEQNAYTGTLNKILKKHATVFFSSYDKNSPVKEYPVDDVFFDKARIRTKIKTVIFLGGSQGAKFINDLAVNVAPILHKRNIHIIHQCGKKDFQRVQEQYKHLKIDVELYGFTHDIADLMSQADLAISRSGASTLWELTANALPALFIPYPYAAGDHQYYNAQFLEEKNLAWIQKETQNPQKKLLEILSIDLQPKSKGLKKLISKGGATKMIDYIRQKVLTC